MYIQTVTLKGFQCFGETPTKIGLTKSITTLIGANGSGKSTFLNALSGEIDVSSGHIHLPQGKRIATLRQDHFTFDGYTVMQTALMGHKELYELLQEKYLLEAKSDITDEEGMRMSEIYGEMAELDGYEAESDAGKLLDGLGITADMHDTPMKALDGGLKKSQVDTQVKSTVTLQKVKTCKVETMAAAKHIALIINGEGINASLDYAIESSLRQNAQIDLLIHGATDSAKVEALEKRIQGTGVYSQKIQIEDNAVDSIVDYAAKQPSLIFIIATADDAVAKALIEEVSAKRSNRVHVPFVLIKDVITASALRQTAA